MALEASGATVSMPESIPLQRNPVLKARSGLDVVAEDDRVGLLASWDRLMSVGASRRLIHLAVDCSESAATFCGFDLREKHGVVVAVFIPADGSDGPAPVVRELLPVKPRFATIHKDENSFMLKVSESVTELLGWDSKDMEGHRSIEFMHPDDHALAVDNWMEMIAAPGPARRVRLRHRHIDGSWVWFEVTNHNLLADPDHGCIVSEMVDISEEMAAHEELRAHEQLLEQLAEALPLGLFRLDTDGKIVYTNARLHEMVGVERADTVRAQLVTVIESDWPVLEQALTAVLREGESADVAVELRASPKAPPRCCAINLRPLSDSDDVVSGAIACVSDVTDNVRMHEELKQRATYDELTGCYNRPSIMRALEAELASDQRTGAVAVMFIDFDRFKEINDRYGHAAGDRLLSAVAHRLKHAIRDGDLIGRIGGDEFLIVCPESGGPKSAEGLAERLEQAARATVRVRGARIVPEVSIGVACPTGAVTDADSLVAEADRAMYDRKRERNTQPAIAERRGTSERAGVKRSRRGELHRAPKR